MAPGPSLGPVPWLQEQEEADVIRAPSVSCVCGRRVLHLNALGTALFENWAGHHACAFARKCGHLRRQTQQMGPQAFLTVQSLGPTRSGEKKGDFAWEGCSSHTLRHRVEPTYSTPWIMLISIKLHLVYFVLLAEHFAKNYLICRILLARSCNNGDELRPTPPHPTVCTRSNNRVRLAPCVLVPSRIKVGGGKRRTGVSLERRGREREREKLQMNFKEMGGRGLTAPQSFFRLTELC